jgi:tetratricopeptide (TPR) repeat protein
MSTGALSSLAAVVMTGLASTVVAQTAAGGPTSTGDRYSCGLTSSKLALPACTRVIKDKGTPPDIRAIALRNRGLRLQLAGDLDGAIADYSSALKLGSPSPLVAAKTYVNRGLAYDRKADDDLALADYGKAVSLSPSLTTAYLDRAAIWIKCGADAKAIADLSEVAKFKPSDALAYRFRSRAYAAKHDIQRASSDDNAAVRLAGKLPEASKSEP